MHRDTLEELLWKADASAAAPLLSDDLATRVQRRLMRRRQHRAAGGLLILIVAITVSSAVVLRRSEPQPAHIAVDPPTIATAPAVAPETDPAITAALHEMTAEKLLAASRRPTSAWPASVSPSPDSELQFARDRAALILVYDAERHEKENRPAAAVAAYRRAADLFPHTHWGEIALRRLKEMQT